MTPTIASHHTILLIQKRVDFVKLQSGEKDAFRAPSLGERIDFFNEKWRETLMFLILFIFDFRMWCDYVLQSFEAEWPYCCQCCLKESYP